MSGTVRADTRAPGGFELDVATPRGRRRVGGLPDHAEGARRRLPDGPPAPLDPQRAPAAPILRVRAEVIAAVRDFFDDRGFILVDTPIFTPAACEGTTTLFPVQYFDDTTAYLTQSGQLYNEANAMALGRVYCFGPTFRAEKSKTRRHLTEFWMVEPEVAFATLDDVIELAEDLVVVGRGARARAPPAGAAQRSSATSSKLELVQKPFPRITLRRCGGDAQREGPALRVGRRLRRARRDAAREQLRPARRGAPLPGAGEGVLHGARPAAARRGAVRATCWRRRATARSSAAASVSTTTTCSLRRIKEHDLPPEAFEWYLDLRRYGTVPHGGFGMGIERVRRLDLRPGSPARGDSVRADAERLYP